MSKVVELLRDKACYYPVSYTHLRHSSDLLVRRYMDPTLGAKSRVVNNGEMRNRGIEFSLTANLIRNCLLYTSQPIRTIYLSGSYLDSGSGMDYSSCYC